MDKSKVARDQAAEAQVLAEDILRLADRVRSHNKRYEVAGLFTYLTATVEIPDENEPDGFRPINIDTDRDIHIESLGFTAGQILDIEYALGKFLTFVEATGGVQVEAPNLLYNAIGLSRANRL